MTRRRKPVVHPVQEKPHELTEEQKAIQLLQQSEQRKHAECWTEINAVLAKHGFKSLGVSNINIDLVR